MKCKYLVWLLPLFLLVSCLSKDNSVIPSDVEPKPKTEISQEVILGVGDEVDISVWRQNDLNKNLAIDTSGNVYFPLIGEIHAAGLTPTQLRQEITDKLSKYIVNPVVDVHVTTIRSQKVHVFGEVNSPGTVLLNQQMYVWEAVSQVGGFSNDANKERVLVIRTSGQQAEPYVVNFKRIFQSGAVDNRLILRSGDIIYVARSKIADVERFMVRINNIVNAFVTVERSVILWPNMVDVLEGKTTSDSGVIISP